jgi:regulatory protein RepA
VKQKINKKHLADLARSGIDAKTAARLGITSLSKGDAYAIPFFDLRGKQLDFVRRRVFDGPTKYLQKTGTKVHLYFPPLVDWQKATRKRSRRILITEGEKKAARACLAGMACVGLTGVNCGLVNGHLPASLLGINWNGRPVEIIPDSDQSTNDNVVKAFIELGDALAAAGAKVSFRDLPTLSGEAKTGLDDYLEARGQKAYDDLPLHALESEVINKRRAKAMLAALPNMALEPVPLDWLTDRPQPPQFLVDPIVPEGAVTVLGGAGGIGKSYLSLWLAMAVATGSRFLQLTTKAGKVVYLAAEDPASILRYRAFALAKRHGFDKKVLAEHLILQPIAGAQLHLVTMRSGMVVQSPQLSALIARLRTLAPRLIVLDPMARFHGTNENDNSALTQVINAAERIANEVGCTVLFLHHVSKDNAAKGNAAPQALRGADAIQAGSRSVLMLTKHDPTAADSVLRLSHGKSSWGAPYKDVWLKRGEHGVLESTDGPMLTKSHDDVLRSVRKWYAANMGKPFTKRALTDAAVDIGASKATLTNLFKTYLEDGVFIDTGKSRNGGALVAFAKELKK